MKKDIIMGTEIYDLRDLMMMIKEKKDLDANLTLEFDCRIEVEDIKPIVKVINYAINYISELTEQTMQISLNASVSGLKLAYTASTTQTVFPEINPQVLETLKQIDATIELDGEPGKFVQLIIIFED